MSNCSTPAFLQFWCKYFSMKHIQSYICTYLRRAWASVSNGDKPHGTTADTCYTAASSGTNYKEREKDTGWLTGTCDYIKKIQTKPLKKRHIRCRTIVFQESSMCSVKCVVCYSLSWASTVAVALLGVSLVAFVPHQFVQSVREGQVQLHVLLHKASS